MALTQVDSGLIESGAALENIGTGNITPAYLNTQAQYTGFKNRIINGAMMIDQRNAGASVTGNNSVFSTDRWKVGAAQSSKFTMQQVTDAPAGFKNSLKITSSSSYSVTSTDEFEMIQFIEGNNVADLNWGTANAAAVTLSFQVKSSLTGTFGGVLYNNATNRCYIFSYTINSANTWESKSVSIAGDTTGTWETGTSSGIAVLFCIGAGSTLLSTAGSWGSTFYRSVTGQVSVVGTNAATWQLTGVQLEKGSTATSFDYRPYGTELALCQRYYWKANGSQGANTGILVGGTTGTTGPAVRRAMILNPVTMRATPTPNYSGSGIKYGTGNGTYYAVTALAYNSSSTMFLSIDVNGGTSITAGQLAHVVIDSTSASDWFEASSEL